MKFFGHYELLKELKTGGMGAVLLARRRGPGAYEQLVAIKTIRAEFAAAEHVRAMFLDEAAILAKLSHPAIARVHDFGEQDGTLYMVMEYVAGIPFRELEALDPPPQIVARAIAEAARGVHAAHELRDLSGSILGVVHRDLSPDNLMLGFDGHVKVIDFGIALVKNRQAPVTEFGTVKGKPPYMSPEQVKNEAIDRRSDVFSLAVVLHELLASKPLFDGDSIYAIARAVEHMEIPRPSVARGGELPSGLDAVVMAALVRDVERRTPTAAMFADALEDVTQVSTGESLAAWTERALAAKREEHRAWLSAIVEGVTAPQPIGRPTGAVTAVGANVDRSGREPGVGGERAAGADAERAAGADRGTAADARRAIGELPTNLAADVVADPPARRSRVPLVIGILVLLLGGAIAIVVLTRTRDAAIANDAAVAVLPVDATRADADAASDAAPVVPALDAPSSSIDAAIADARVAIADARIASPRDAAIVTRDAAAPVPMAIDAAIVAPVGTGILRVYNRANSPYVNVLIDGKLVGPTPQNKLVLSAGKHAVQLVSPETSAVVYETSVTIEVGGSTTVRQP